ncbi:hypothetical protein K8352_11630 [Flavobacteriaceae bacterium F89]|uniref:Sugar transporter n=1 Tax=Cerina litoralis TaxID=2874477 RepID=A0AAE3JTC9_9FLAO|nr:hypothetical protein [Cerina litoralis]MCG2461402.1 hypothetical protein [Cerina litoralis]
MTEKSTIKPPTWFWVVSVLGLLWNLMGAMAYLGQAFMTDEMKEALPAEQVALMENTPAWVTAAFAVAVWGGLLGCIGLLLRKKWAQTLFLISLVGILAQFGYSYFMTNAAEVYGAFQAKVMPLLIIGAGIALLYFSGTAEKRRWIL